MTYSHSGGYYSGLFEIKFEGVDELLKVSERRYQLLDANIKAAVTRTVLWGAGKISADAPIDTGRLRASILGELAQRYGIALNGDPAAIAEGINQSLTSLDVGGAESGYEGKIGTAVEYAAYQEYGFTVNKKLTEKQRRYLFAVGILKNVNGKVVLTRSRKTSGVGRSVPGRAFFRRNLILIDQYFQEQMREAIRYTNQDKQMPVTF